jgi:hypothetical protein
MSEVTLAALKTAVGCIPNFAPSTYWCLLREFKDACMMFTEMIDEG